MITKIAFVSHPTKDMAKSKKFFGEVLGLKQAASYEDKWCEFDTPDGKSIALDTFSPQDKGPYLALESDNIEKDLARLRKKGVPVVMDLMDNKVCKMAIVQDPSGHSLMLHQMEPGRLKAQDAARAAAAAPRAKAAAAKPTKAAAPKATKAAAKASRPKASKPKAAAKPAVKPAARKGRR